MWADEGLIENKLHIGTAVMESPRPLIISRGFGKKKMAVQWDVFQGQLV